MIAFLLPVCLWLGKQTDAAAHPGSSAKLQLISKLQKEWTQSSYDQLYNLEEDEDFAVCAAAERAILFAMKSRMDDLGAKMDKVETKAQFDALQPEMDKIIAVQIRGEDMGKFRGRLLREGHSQDWRVREKLLLDIAKDGKFIDDDRQTSPGIEGILHDDVLALREAVSLTGEQCLDLLQREDVTCKYAVLDCLHRPLSAALRQEVLVLTRDPLASIRASALCALDQDGSAEADDVVIHAASDQSEWVRYFAAAALCERHSERALDALTLLCYDADGRVAREAFGSLPKESTPQIRHMLRMMITDPRPDMRATACETIGDRKDKLMLGELQAALKDPDPDVARAAQDAIDSINSGT